MALKKKWKRLSVQTAVWVIRGIMSRKISLECVMTRDPLYCAIKTSRITGNEETQINPALYQKSASSRDGLVNIRVIKDSQTAPTNNMIEKVATPGVYRRCQL